MEHVLLSDSQLANYHFFHDKRLLYTFLGQPYFELAPGDYIAKPAISTEGLGLGVKNLNIPSTYVVQPKLTGQYLNVDVDADFELRITEGSITESHTFRYFRYVGSQEHHLTPTQLGKLKALHRFSDVLNVEFIGDDVLEAHARESHEFESLYDHADVYNLTTSDVYFIPSFVSVVPEPPPQVQVLEIVELSGGGRECGVVVLSDSVEAVVEFSEQLR